MTNLRLLGRKTSLVLIALVGAFALSGCAKKTSTKEAGGAAGVGGESEYANMKTGGIGLGLLERIHFDFDKSEIQPTAIEILKKNAATIKGSNTMRVLVEGHCDERGTVEYNLALGERRAKSVVSYLVSLGVPRSRLETKSWGEEKPLDATHTEAAWAKNRRAEFVILSK